MCWLRDFQNNNISTETNTHTERTKNIELVCMYRSALCVFSFWENVFCSAVRYSFISWCPIHTTSGTWPSWTIGSLWVWWPLCPRRKRQILLFSGSSLRVDTDHVQRLRKSALMDGSSIAHARLVTASWCLGSWEWLSGSDGWYQMTSCCSPTLPVFAQYKRSIGHLLTWFVWTWLVFF